MKRLPAKQPKWQPASNVEVREVTQAEHPGPTETPVADLDASGGLYPHSLIQELGTGISEGPGCGVRLVEPRGEAPVRGESPPGDEGQSPFSGGSESRLSSIPTDYSSSSAIPMLCAENIAVGQTVLLGEAQMGLGGGFFDPKRAGAGTCDDPFGEPDPRDPRICDLQKGFEFDKPVQMTFPEWQVATARQLRAASGLPGGFADKRGERISECGSMMVVAGCKDCGVHEQTATRSANCEARTCPSCSRTRSKRQAAKLLPFMRRFPINARGRSWTMITITVPRPTGTNVRRLQRDKDTAFRGWKKACWPMLKKLGFARALAKVEVSPGGMVHLHALAYGPFIPKDALKAMRAGVVELGCGEQFNLARLRKGRGGIAEVVKYCVKGVAVRDRQGEQTHPVLCAMTEVAFAQKQLLRWYGRWGKLAKPCRHCGEVLCDCSSWTCAACDGHRRMQIYMTMPAFERWQARPSAA